MKKLLKISAILIIAAVAYSIVPVVGLYLSPSPAPYTNTQAIERLEGNTGDYFEFMVLGDNHAGLIFNDSTALKMIRKINREDRFGKLPIDFVVIAGDVTNRGSEWDYRIFNALRSRIKWPVISAFGNHDNDKGGEARFEKYIGQGEISFANRNSYFIILNNEIGDLTDEQFKKFESDLKRSSIYKHRFVFLHKPPISPYQQSWYRPELSPWSYRFMKLCEEYKVDMVFSGHEHMFRQMEFGGVKYIITGGGGMLTTIPTDDGGFTHYSAVRVYGDYVDYEVRQVFPPLWTELCYYLWKDIFYFLKEVLL